MYFWCRALRWLSVVVAEPYLPAEIGAVDDAYWLLLSAVPAHAEQFTAVD
jgi:hypothetical protein